MSIRYRILILFLVAAFVPFTALGMVVQRSFIDGLEQEHRAELELRVASARRRITQMNAADRRTVEALCEHDMLVDRLVLDLATDRFTPDREQSMVAMVPPLMQGRRFDTLYLLDARPGENRGRVLGAGHYPERVGASERPLLDAFNRAEALPFVDEVRVADGASPPRDEKTLLTGCTVDRDGARVAIIAGRFLNERLPEELFGDVSPVHFVLGVDPSRVELAGSGAPMTVEHFRNARGDDAMLLLAQIDDAPLQEEVSALKRRGIWIAVVALLGTLLIAVFFTWYLTRPLRDLESAARRVGQGDLESQMRVKRQDEMGSVMSAFNEMTRELASTRRKLLRAERIAAWREVARRIAHEIKNPLQPIQMEVETLRKLHSRKHPSFDDEFDGSTQVILDEVKRLDDMVTEFSRFARLPRPKPKSIDLRDIVDHVVSLHQHDDVSVQAAVPEHAVTIKADRDQLTQVIVNLVQNATEAARARHGTAGGEVWLEVEEQPDGDGSSGASLRIEDNGPGISAEDRLRVFEPYFTTKSSGTGLGLAIVHRIIGDHGGSIDVEEGHRQGGALFVAWLPESGPPEGIAATLGDTAIPLGRASQRPPADETQRD